MSWLLCCLHLNGEAESRDIVFSVKPVLRALKFLQHNHLNRRIEQDNRGVKQRYYPMLGFGEFSSAQRFCRAFEEFRPYFRPRRRRKQFVSLSRGRQQFIQKARVLQSIFLAA